MRWTLALLAAAGCSSTVEPATNTISVSTIGRAGGTVVAHGDAEGAQVVIPFGALSQDTPVAVGADPSPPDDPAGYVAAGPSVIFSPEGLGFTRPVTVVLPYRGLSDVVLFSSPAVAGVPWEFFDGGRPDPAENVVSAGTDHFSRWRAFRLAPPDAGPGDGGNE